MSLYAMRRSLACGLTVAVALFLIAMATAGVAQAQGRDNGPITAQTLLQRWEIEAADIEVRLDRSTISDRDLGELRQILETQRDAIPQLRSDVTDDLGPLAVQLEALGPPPDEGGREDPSVAAERERLERQIERLEGLDRSAAQADARARALIDRVGDLRRRLFTEQLLERGHSPLDPDALPSAMRGLHLTFNRLKTETLTGIDNSTMGVPLIAVVVGPLVLIGVALFFLIGVRRAALEYLLGAVTDDTERSRRVSIAAAVTLVRLLLPLVALGLVFTAVWNSGVFGPLGKALLQGLVATAGLVIAAYALGGAFFSPRVPQLRLSILDEAEARAAHRRLMTLAAIVGIEIGLVARAREIGVSLEALSLINAVLLVAGGIALLLLLRVLYPIIGPAPAGDEEDAEAEEERSFVLPALAVGGRFLGHISAITAPCLALMGFYAASRYVFFPLVLSGGVIGFCLLLYHVIQAVFGVADRQETDGQRTALDAANLIPAIAGFVLFAAALPVLGLIWGADPADIVDVWRQIEQGVRLGDVVISPVDFFWFAAIFSLVYLATRVVQKVLARSVLPFTGLDVGGRAAINAGVGYVGIALAALMAISGAGLDLSNLAIVAGALSVGIGFGLQNIVNNFVSGIILLVERPIKAGDWVELPSGHGYVQKVNVRSTQIETFDRSMMFVPNSELISGIVVNWTHSNLNGRIIVKVGVAYGTEPRKVERVLLEIARGHPMMLRRPAPYVLFNDFGSDALEFQIRGVLRDVNWILNVQSDLRFEIARRFEEEGIEVPFSQSDLYLRNADEVAGALSKAFRNGALPEAADDLAGHTSVAHPTPVKHRTAAGHGDGEGES